MKSNLDHACRSFEKNTEGFAMEVVRDDGVHRHLRFQREGTWSYGFNLVTWPGHLCFEGNVGTYVFRRHHDMLEFFRNGLETIPFDYWAEKAIAVDRNCGVEEDSEELFREAMNRDLDEMEASEELREAAEDEFLSQLGVEPFDRLVGEACSFEFEGRYPFECFYEHILKDHTVQFYWACLAIAWAVGVYDASKTEAANA